MRVENSSLAILGNRAAPISISSALGSKTCVSTVNATVGVMSSGSMVHLPSMHFFLKMLSAKEGSSMHYFPGRWPDLAGALHLH